MQQMHSGSVLMEFLIVLPLYMLIFGFAFVAGEMALETIHLDASADRTFAMTPTDQIKTRHEDVVFDYFKRVIAPHDARDGQGWDHEDSWREKTDYNYAGDDGGSENVSSFRKVRIECAHDGDFAGPWTQSVAAWVKDDYTLTPLTRGIVAFWYRENDRMLEDQGSAPDTEGFLYTILGQDNLGRVETVGKSLCARESGAILRDYGYYCLRRDNVVRNIERDDSRLPYRYWTAGSLAENLGWVNVAAEEHASTHYGDIEDKGDLSGAPPPSDPGDVAAYERNGYFRSWMP